MSDAKTWIKPVNNVFHLKGFVRTPEQMVSIKWESDDGFSSGSTECQAWRCQYEIDCLDRAGHKILAIDPRV